MFKAIKIFFLATVVAVAFGAMPFAKEKDVHNKGPVVELVKGTVAHQVVAPVVAEVPAIDIPTAPAVVNALYVLPASQFETVTTQAQPPPEYGRWQYARYDNNRSLQHTRWKDIHRKLCFI